VNMNLPRFLKITCLAFASMILTASVIILVVYKSGYLSDFIKQRLTQNLDRIGIAFKAEEFSVELFPMTIKLRNADFLNKSNSEKLFQINSARIQLSLGSLWSFSQRLDVKSTEIDGLQVWVKFDKQGKSNFSGLDFVEEEGGYVELNYSSANLDIKNGIAHFGDISRQIQAKASDIYLRVFPEKLSDEQIFYHFDLSSKDGLFSYRDKTIEGISIHAEGKIDHTSAEITSLRIKSQISEATLSGKIENLQNFRYVFDINAKVSLSAIGKMFDPALALDGNGGLTGKIFGEGEQYRIEGELITKSLSTPIFSLKNFQSTVGVKGNSRAYEASGQLIADMLNIGDFKLNLLRATSLVYGTGSDLKWFFDLQSASVNSPLGSIVSLYMKDAIAKYENEKISARIGILRANKILSPDFQLESVVGRDFSIDNSHDVRLSKLQAGRLKSNGIRIDNLSSDNILLSNEAENLKIARLRAESLRTDGATLKNLTAQNLSGNPSKNLKIDKLEAGLLQSEAASISGLKALDINLYRKNSETLVNAPLLRLGAIESSQVSLGGIDIAGVKLSIRSGVVTATSDDIEAGDALVKKTTDFANEGKIEKITIKKPLFTLEPSGKYRASADITIGGGNIGSLELGNARVGLVLTNEQLQLKDINADLMEGKLLGEARISFVDKNSSVIRAEFADIDLSKLLLVQSGKVLPLSGKLRGKAELSFPQSEIRLASGLIQANFQATAGNSNVIPVTGVIELAGDKGLFNLRNAELRTAKTDLSASGVLDFKGEGSNLNISMSSMDAGEVQYLFRAFEIAPEVDRTLTDNRIEIAGQVRFNGKFVGGLENAQISGRADLQSLIMRNYRIGSLTADVLSSNDKVLIRNGRLEDAGGYIFFDIEVPRPLKNNLMLQASIERFNPENLIMALPLENYLPERLRKINTKVSGKISLDGLPNEASGEIVLDSTQGSIAEEPFDAMTLRVRVNKTLAVIDDFKIRQGESFVTLKGSYEGESTAFDLNISGQKLSASKLFLFLPQIENLPTFSGLIDFNGFAKGEALDFSTYNINFEALVNNFAINQNPMGSLNLRGFTEDKKLVTVLLINLDNQTEKINAEVDLADEKLPLRIFSNLNETNLRPFLALYPARQDLQLSGTASGKILIEGNLLNVDQQKNRTFSLNQLKGNLDLAHLSLEINDIPIVSKEPVAIRFSANEVAFENAKFISAGSELVISGNKALRDDAMNDLSVSGFVNLRLLDLLFRDVFLTGSAEVYVRLTGVNRDARLSGNARLDNASLAIFVGSEKLNFDRINGGIIFTSNQVQIENLVGYLGGGKVVTNGGATLKNLQLENLRIDLSGRNVTAALPKDFVTTGNAEISITSRRVGNDFDTLIAGTIYAKRSVYSKNIDLADIVSSRRESSITEGGSSNFSVPRFDLTLIGRDALFVKNNIADLTASVDLRITGDANSPILIGRITANEGTLFYRNEQYLIRRGILELPAQLDRDPFINLQTEAEIQGYRVNLELSGELSDRAALSLKVSSNPPLPQADIVSLITTGSFASVETGVTSPTQSGISTAAELLTDALVSSPIRRATDKLFGLSRFEISPVISGVKQTPTARLTVGRRINRNLIVTYSTNLSEDQRQILSVEYRVSNRLSLIAQYEQKSLNNFVRSRDSFSFEIRFRKKF